MKRHFIITVIFLLLSLTGCSVINISEEDIPVGNSIGLFKYQTDYNSDEQSCEIIDNMVNYKGVEFEVDSNFEIDSESSNVVLFKDDDIFISLSVYDNSVDESLYRDAFNSKLKELYPDFKFSFDGSLMLLGEGGLNWDCYQGCITDSEKDYEIKGYYTLDNNKLVAIEFGVLSSKSIEDYEEVQNLIMQSINIK